MSRGHAGSRSGGIERAGMALGIVGLLLSGGPLRAEPVEPVEEAPPSRAEILQERRPAIVRVEALVETRFNMGGQGQEQESRLDLDGALVDDRGLVMIWNSHISSNRMTDMMREMGRGEDFGIEVRPTEFEVILEGGEEIPAFLAATDSPLDLAFLQLERQPETPVAPVRFSESVDPSVGDEVLVIHRLGEGFDFAPYVDSARIGGELKKPRRAWILDGDLGGFGLPVFDRRGRPVGALMTILSRAGEEAPFRNMGFGNMMGMMGGQGNFGPFGVFVLPGSRVASLVDLARERADEILEEIAARDEEG